MTDPLLFLHRVQGTENVYDTGSIQWLASIRDQILRACWIVDRAFESKRIGIDKPLLVVGAGAAGVGAALRSADRKVPTYLVEHKSIPFSRQADCSTRWIDPSVYEWPQCHHLDTVWGETPPMPLPYEPRLANEIVRECWHPRFERLKDHPHVRQYWGYSIDEIPKPYNGALVAKLTASKTKTHTAIPISAALWAIGQGDEDTRCKSFKGFPFWETDPYDQDPLLPDGRKARVLISGGGDGALQDLLRVAFNPTLVRNPRALLSLLGSLSSDDLARIQSAEEQALRALVWSGGDFLKTHDHPVLEKLHREHIRIASAFAALPHVQTAIEGMLRNPFPHIVFAHPCTHFARSFALNHFLGLVLLEVLQRTRRIVQLPNMGVDDVTPAKRALSAKHVCGKPDQCHGVDHDVANFAPS